MGKGNFLLTFVFFSLLFSSLALASIYTCDSYGNEKTSFYTNDTVYVTSSANITNESKTIKFYVLAHSTWPFGTNLTTSANFSKDIATNSSGHMPIAVLWSPVLKVGNYDVIADINGNATFDSGDLLYNATGDGFSVIEQPLPRLTISKGSNSPTDHSMSEENLSLPNEMLQVKLEAGSYEGLNVKSFYLSASGSGDDENGIRYAGVCLDENEDGSCGFDEESLGFGQYSKDDGIVKINLEEGLHMSENSSLSLVFFYYMRNGSGSPEGKTYSFQFVRVEAFGSTTGNRAVVRGLPIMSAIKTVYSQAVATTTTTTTIQPQTTTTTTTIQTTTTTIPKEEEERVNLFIGIAVAIFAAVAIITVFYFFFLRPPHQVYTYKPS